MFLTFSPPGSSFGLQNLISEITLAIDFGIFIDELDRFHAHTSSKDVLGWFRIKKSKIDFS